MMVVVDSLYPDCTVNTGDIANTLAATHFQIGASGFHSGGTPDGAQSNATPFTVVWHGEKLKHLSGLISVLDGETKLLSATSVLATIAL